MSNAIAWKSRVLGSRAELAGHTATVLRNGFTWSWRIETNEQIICSQIAGSQMGAQAAAEACLATLVASAAEQRR